MQFYKSDQKVRTTSSLIQSICNQHILKIVKFEISTVNLLLLFRLTLVRLTMAIIQARALIQVHACLQIDLLNRQHCRNHDQKAFHSWSGSGSMPGTQSGKTNFSSQGNGRIC